MPDQATRGRGLAENADLQATLAEILDADAAARTERDAYARLSSNHPDAAAGLRAIAGEMSGYRVLPMAPHDRDVMRSPRLRAAFERLIALEKDLRAYLDERIEREERMLAGAPRN